MRTTYIIGAQCTGKTTLCRALKDDIETTDPVLDCQLLSETAREVLQQHSFSREDIREGGTRCLQLQQLIMDGQLEVETRASDQGADLIISDRSGLDALVYAEMFCGPDSATELLSSVSWQQLRLSITNGLVIVCEPVKEWLYDDGTRIMPMNWSEWLKLHELFLQILERYHIDHVILPASVRCIRDRVAFVRNLYTSVTNGNPSSTTSLWMDNVDRDRPDQASKVLADS